jgi:transposase
VPVDFAGTLQCDGYAAYPAFARQHPQPIQLAGCWAHVRRKFYDAREQSPKVTGWFLRQIQLLYQVEAVLREKKAGPVLRAAMRACASRWNVERLHRALVRHKTRHLPKSLLGQAIDYALGQWPTLEVYLGDGRVEIDNNRVENAIRPTAVGKKNWLFMGEAGAGQRGAILYTVVESCRCRGLDPYAYLKDVLTRLPDMKNHQIPEILPAAWARSRQPRRQIAA